MKSEFVKLIASIKSGAKPDLRDLSDWLSMKSIPADVWTELSAVLIEGFGLSGQKQLAQEMRNPNFTKVSGYVDDFSPILNEIELKGWLRDFVEHTRQMEAPTPYHFGSALTVLGAALRRKVWVDQGYYKIWPAIQTMLVGPSGVTKKSTASGYAVRVGTAANAVLSEKGGKAYCFNYLINSGSGESLISQLARFTKTRGEATGLVYVSELSTWVNKQEHNVNLVQLLTDLFDSPDHKKKETKSRGHEVLKNVAVSCLFGTNEEWLTDAIPPSALAGGFMSRMLTWFQDDTDREFSRPVVSDENEFDRLVGGLIQASMASGPAVLTPGADKWYDGWYRGRKHRRPENERLQAFYQRIPDHLLRMAMLLSVSEDPTQREKLTIEEHHLLQGEAILNWILKYLPRVYAYVDITGYGRERQKIITFIRNRGGMVSQTELGRKMSGRMTMVQLKEHLDHLKKYNIIKSIKLSPWEGTYGWKLLRKDEEL